MRSLSISDTIDSSYKWAYIDYLYNHADFQEINNDLPQKSFFLVDKAKNEVYGHLSVQLLEGKAISHVSAPYGGISFSDQISEEEKLFFGLEIKRRLSKDGLQELLLHQPPKLSKNDHGFERSLDYAGFNVVKQREYQMISLLEDFEVKLHEMEKRKFKKSIEKGFRFELARPSELKGILDFVIEQRSVLGYEFSMGWEQLKEYQKAFPENYFGARVWDGDQLISASILVKESSGVLYQFAPAHIKRYNKYSPVVFLTKQICEWAKTQGFTWLNLGTSYLDDQRNEGLYSFKEKLGAEVFVASSLQKMINS